MMPSPAAEQTHPQSVRRPEQFGDYRQRSFHDLLRSSRCIPERSGAYAIYIRGGDLLLGALGFQAGRRSGLASPVADHVHVYTGSSGSLRDRVKCHCKGDVRASNLRKTLLAAEEFCGAILATGRPLPDARTVEEALDLWLASNAWLVYWRADDYRRLEGDLLASTASPLNVVRRRSEDFSKRLMGLRSAYDRRPILPHCAAAVRGILHV